MTHAIHDIPVTSIDPSPYQHRKHFSRDALQELAKSIERDGLVEPIVVRPLPDGYELIAGERRVRAVKEYTTLDTILARIVDVTDLQARRMCATENMQREDLSAVEMVGAIVELIDAELIDDEEYASKGGMPVERVKWVLGRLTGADNAKSKNYEVTDRAQSHINNFVNTIERIFSSLPKPIQWRAFYNHDLPLVTDLDPTVMEWAIANKLNKSQTKALNDMKRQAPALFQELAQQADEDGRITITNEETGEVEDLRDHSARELKDMALERRMNTQTLENTQITAPHRHTIPYRLIHSDIHTLDNHIPAESVDTIITDPPYPREYLHVYDDLARIAAITLKPGGSCFVMIGQSYMPDILASMAKHLTYHWTLAYLTPGGQAVQLWQRNVNTFWKPVIWFVKGTYTGKWLGDVAKSAVNDNDKRFHEWGQSESGMADLVERCSTQGDIILDPFCGAGTTGVVAITLGRSFIGADNDQSAQDRTEQRICGK